MALTKGLAIAETRWMRVSQGKEAILPLFSHGRRVAIPDDDSNEDSVQRSGLERRSNCLSLLDHASFHDRAEKAFVTISDIERLEERLRLAMLASDLEELDCLLSDRLLFVTPDGANVRKEADLGAHRSGLIRVSALAPLERHIEHFGSMAIVNVEMEMAGSFAGSRFEGHFRYTRVWYEEGGRTKVVAGHVCSIK